MRRLKRALATAAVIAAGGLAGAAPALANPQPTPHGTVLTFAGDPSSATGAAAGNTSCDINADGYSDTVVGAWFWDKAPNNNIGATYVLLGSETAHGGELADPADVNAVRIDGPNVANAFTGFAASCAGDVNGDGFDDVLVSHYTNATAYVVFGARDFEPVTLDALGDRGFSVRTAEGSNFGYSVSALGDVTGDGLDDFAVGAVVADTQGRTNNGRVWVVRGRTDITDIDLQTNAGGDGYLAIDGALDEERLGVASAVGDVNGDGVNDLLLGSYTSTPWGSGVAVPGAAYVIWGGQGGFVDAADLTGKGFAIRGPQRQRDRLGISVSAAGDVNDDGKADLLIGADGVTNAATGPRNGGAAIVYGSDSEATVFTDPVGDPSVYTCPDPGSAGACPDDAVSRGYWINGAAQNDSTGYAVAGVGDVNGDGVPDHLIGAYGYDPVDPANPAATLSNAGAVYVVYGAPSATGTIELASLTEAQGFRVDGGLGGSRLGRSVGNAGDFDGNGVTDLLLGADFANDQRGYAAIVLRGDLRTATRLTVGSAEVPVATVTSLRAEVRRPVDGNVALTAGAVRFSLDGAVIPQCEAVALNADGEATCAYDARTAGVVTVTAEYLGSTGLATSSAQTTVTVTAPPDPVDPVPTDPIPTPTPPTAVPTGPVAGSLELAVPGRIVHGTPFTATVTVRSSVAANGTVRVRLGNRVLGSATLTDGVASVRVPGTAVPAGARTLTATFTSAADAVTASDVTVRRTVLRATSRLTARVVRNDIRRGTNGSVRVTVSAKGVRPTGVVVIRRNGKTLRAVRLTAAGRGTVTVRLPRLATGRHALRVFYLTSPNVRASNAGTTLRVLAR